MFMLALPQTSPSIFSQVLFLRIFVRGGVCDGFFSDLYLCILYQFSGGRPLTNDVPPDPDSGFSSFCSDELGIGSPLEF